MDKKAEESATVSQLAQTVDQAAHGLHNAIDTATKAARPAMEQLVAGAHRATDKVSVAAIQAAESLAQKGQQVRDTEARFAASCRKQIQDNPLASLGIAVAAGFALSWLLRRSGGSRTNE